MISNNFTRTITSSRSLFRFLTICFCVLCFRSLTLAPSVSFFPTLCLSLFSCLLCISLCTSLSLSLSLSLFLSLPLFLPLTLSLSLSLSLPLYLSLIFPPSLSISLSPSLSLPLPLSLSSSLSLFLSLSLSLSLSLFHPLSFFLPARNIRGAVDDKECFGDFRVPRAAEILARPHLCLS